MGDGTYLRRARRPGNGPSLRWRAGLSLIRQSPKTPQVADRQETSLSFPPPGLARPAVSSRNGQTQFEALQLALQLTRRGHCGLDNRYGAEVEFEGVT